MNSRRFTATNDSVLDTQDDRIVHTGANASRIARRLNDFNRNAVTGMGRKSGRPNGMMPGAVDHAVKRLASGAVR